MIELWSPRHLFRGTFIPPHLVKGAVLIANTIQRDSMSEGSYKEGDRYFRYAFETEEVDGLPLRGLPL